GTLRVPCPGWHWSRRPSEPASCLLPGPLEPVCQFRAPFLSYASCATSREDGSVHRAVRRSPASTGLNPMLWIRPAATPMDWAGADRRHHPLVGGSGGAI